MRVGYLCGIGRPKRGKEAGGSIQYYAGILDPDSRASLVSTM